MGHAAGDDFLNAAAELETSLDLPEILAALQHIEARCGRVRHERWGPRPLDLDLLLHASATCATSLLTVPHPYLWYRRFVLDPLTEIAGNVVHPHLGETIQELQARLQIRPLSCAISGGTAETRETLFKAFSNPALMWLTDSESSAKSNPTLIFSLGGVTSANTASRRIIDLAAFPTSNEQTVRDVLTAALNERL